MAIVELRILPPLAIGRLGSSDGPARSLRPRSVAMLALSTIDGSFRVRAFSVDPKTGELESSTSPSRSASRNRTAGSGPLAPFLEVFAITVGFPREAWCR